MRERVCGCWLAAASNEHDVLFRLEEMDAESFSFDLPIGTINLVCRFVLPLFLISPNICHLNKWHVFLLYIAWQFVTS